MLYAVTDKQHPDSRTRRKVLATVPRKLHFIKDKSAFGMEVHINASELTRWHSSDFLLSSQRWQEHCRAYLIVQDLCQVGARDLRKQQAHALRQAPALREYRPDLRLGVQAPPQPGVAPLRPLYQRRLPCMVPGWPQAYAMRRRCRVPEIYTGRHVQELCVMQAF